ncbi:alpha/beta hydrolase [Altererythrobacter sp. ZODW24]|uniref:alpha/beta hydrolase n=1 Tax=Altererythrobacter sp. ZODW24 TaxID=2185142 RepID=UPI000DF77E0E|nr:alpha/beta hydrolase [Altererythrobacter sp. ZODW24]
MPDKPHFVREDVKMLLGMLEQMGGTPLEHAPLDEGRAGYIAMGPMVEAEPRDLAVIKDLTCTGPAGDIPLRLYDARESREAGPVIMFYHGGGFVIGNLQSHHALCTEIAATMDLPVVAVDYRLAPEAPFPAAPDDCEAATRWVASNPAETGLTANGLIVMGDSAGGNLALVTAHSLRKEPAEVPVIMQVPLYPVASDVAADKSRADFAEGFLLTGATMDWFNEQYGGGADDPRNFPMLDDGAGSPPTVLCTAGLDPLRDSGRQYAAKLIDSGTDVTYLEFAGSIHGFANLRKVIPSAQKDTQILLDAMKDMLGRNST